MSKLRSVLVCAHGEDSAGATRGMCPHCKVNHAEQYEFYDMVAEALSECMVNLIENDETLRDIDALNSLGGIDQVSFVLRRHNDRLYRLTLTLTEASPDEQKKCRLVMFNADKKATRQ